MMLFVYRLLQVLDLIAKGGIKGITHITGGGFTDNIPRVFPKGLGCNVNVGKVPQNNILSMTFIPIGCVRISPELGQTCQVLEVTKVEKEFLCTFLPVKPTKQYKC